MAKFKFYQDKEVRTWVRDYFEVEAERAEDAVAFLEEQCDCLDNMEYYHSDRVEFIERDDNVMFSSMDEEGTRFCIFDMEDNEIVNKDCR